MKPSTLVLIVGLAGCAAGPDFQRPAAPAGTDYTPSPLPTTTASVPTSQGEAQQLVMSSSGANLWWQTFNAPKLDRLIADALAASPNLAAAQAALRQAQELQAAQAGATQLPQVDAGLSAQRQRSNPSTFGQSGDGREFALYNAGITVRYSLDLAGGNRRTLEALAARTDYRRYQLDATRLTLAGNIATTAISRARLAAQIDTTRQLLANQEQQLEIAQARLRLGQAAPDEVFSLESQMAQTRAGLPPLRKQLHQSEHLLAVLAGRAPAQGAVPEFTLTDFQLPSRLPLVLPSELVRRRPDIQAAEALLQAANADYGVAVAKLYPRVNLSANLASQALSSGALFGPSSALWSMVGGLTQPLFNPGLPAEKRAALAAFDAAAANYQSVVLEALRNVADVLRALEHDAEALAAQARADQAAQNFLNSVEQRYQLGAVSYAQLLLAQQQALQTRLNLSAAQAQRLTATVALYQAMDSGVGAVPQTDH